MVIATNSIDPSAATFGCVVASSRRSGRRRNSSRVEKTLNRRSFHRQSGPSHAYRRRDIRTVAREHARKVLAEHFPQAIDPALDRELRQRFRILLPETAMRPSGG